MNEKKITKLSFDTKILIVGLGLMGGSYAKTLTSLGFDVCGLNRSGEPVKTALENGWIREGRVGRAEPEFISQFELIIFAVYPEAFKNWIRENQQYIRPNAVITDVTGVKTSIVYDIQDMLRSDVEFVPSHPMAGRETCGIAGANIEMFRGANFIITPTDKNTEEGIDLCRRLGMVMGFRKVSVLTPQEHDEMIGFLSQLTHCVAVALMCCKDSTRLVDYTGDSFRDLTRIAKINDKMWSELFMLNREELLKQMDLFADTFKKLRDTLADGDVDTMREMMRESTEHRKYFDKK